jgi:hypothetical protein
MATIHINGVPVTFHHIGSDTVTSIGQPRAEYWLTDANDLEAMRHVVRELSHTSECERRVS